MRKRLKNFSRITIILIICLFIITGCGNAYDNKYELDKSNPIAVQI